MSQVISHDIFYVQPFGKLENIKQNVLLIALIEWNISNKYQTHCCTDTLVYRIPTKIPYKKHRMWAVEKISPQTYVHLCYVSYIETKTNHLI